VLVSVKVATQNITNEQKQIQ